MTFSSDVQQIFKPGDVSQLCEILHSAEHVLPIGGQTKSAFAAPASSCQLVDCQQLSGIVTYDPSEFLITARSGTSLKEICLALQANGQYLPFDPLLVESGSTLGGTIAAGLSGSCRLLYGGLRDFVMAIEFVDGLGQVVCGGGKVVKNAAGFDFPKLLIGSYGRLGIITEATIKVLPSPQAWGTLVTQFQSLPQALKIVRRWMSLPLPIAAADIDANADEVKVYMRIAGLRSSLAGVFERLKGQLPQTSQATAMDAEVERHFWHDRSRLGYGLFETTEGFGVRVAMPAQQVEEFQRSLTEQELAKQTVYTSGSAVAWLRISGDHVEALDGQLKEMGLSAVVTAGTRKLLPLGNCTWIPVASRIQTSIDPQRKFLPYPQATVV